MSRAALSVRLSRSTLTEIVKKRQTWFLLHEAGEDLPTSARASAMVAHPLGLDDLPPAPSALSLVGQRVALVDFHPSTVRADVMVLGAVEFNSSPTVQTHILSIKLINVKEFPCPSPK